MYAGTAVWHLSFWKMQQESVGEGENKECGRDVSS